MGRPDKKIVIHALMQRERERMIRQSVQLGWEETEEFARNHVVQRVSTLRAIMWDLTSGHLKVCAAKDPGWKVERRDDTYYHHLDQQVTFRFKKADAQLMTSNIPTDTAQLYHDHRADLFGHNHRVDVVYYPDHLNQQIEWLGVVARDHDTRLWEYEIDLHPGSAPTHRLRAPSREQIKQIQIKGTVGKAHTRKDNKSRS